MLKIPENTKRITKIIINGHKFTQEHQQKTIC